MKPFVVALSAIVATSSIALAQNAQSDRRCVRHVDREQSDRCNCTAEAGGKVIGVDAKGFNRWDLPPANMGAYVACLKRKGYRT
jgi:hypothetical protein